MSNQFEILKVLNQEAIRFHVDSGNRFCNELADLCNQEIIEINGYDTRTDPEYGDYVQIHCIFKLVVNDRVFFLHGAISFSFSYFYSRPANIYFADTEELTEFNTADLLINNYINSDYGRNWNENSSVVDFVLNTLELLRNALVIIPVIPFEQLAIKKRLGKGSFGEVYKGMYNGHEIAVKRLFDSNAISDNEKERYVRRLRREVFYGCNQNHPNLMKIYGVSYDPNQGGTIPMMIMEYWGESLKRYMDKMGSRISIEERKQIILGIARGLQYMHSQGLVHRDLKLENILIKDGLVKITDYGFIYRLNDDQSTEATGTPIYKSPELCYACFHRQDCGSILTAKADVYSLGCMMIEILSGSLKFSFPLSHIKTQSGFYEAIINGGRPVIPDYLNDAVKYTIGECLKDVEDRISIDEAIPLIQNWTF